jgi:hypothetical protein
MYFCTQAKVYPGLTDCAVKSYKCVGWSVKLPLILASTVILVFGCFRDPWSQDFCSFLDMYVLRNGASSSMRGRVGLYVCLWPVHSSPVNCSCSLPAQSHETHVQVFLSDNSGTLENIFTDFPQSERNGDKVRHFLCPTLDWNMVCFRFQWCPLSRKLDGTQNLSEYSGCWDTHGLSASGPAGSQWHNILENVDTTCLTQFNPLNLEANLNNMSSIYFIENISMFLL